jgi:hypothetical protein
MSAAPSPSPSRPVSQPPSRPASPPPASPAAGTAASSAVDRRPRVGYLQKLGGAWVWLGGRMCQRSLGGSCLRAPPPAAAKGPLRLWKTRWFVFDPRTCRLAYFRNRDARGESGARPENPLSKGGTGARPSPDLFSAPAAAPQGLIDVSQAVLALQPALPAGFAVMLPGREFRLAAEAPDTMLQWLQTLQVPVKAAAGLGFDGVGWCYTPGIIVMGGLGYGVACSLACSVFISIYLFIYLFILKTVKTPHRRLVPSTWTTIPPPPPLPLHQAPARRPPRPCVPTRPTPCVQAPVPPVNSNAPKCPGRRY